MATTTTTSTIRRTQRSISDPHLPAGRLSICEGSNLPASQMRHHRRSVDRVWPPALEIRIARLSIDEGSTENRPHIIPVPPPINYNRFPGLQMNHSEPLSSTVIESDEEAEAEADDTEDTPQAPLTSLPRPLKPRMPSMLPPHLQRMSSMHDPELVGGFYRLDEQQQQNYQQGRYPHIHVEYGGQHQPRRLSKVYKESFEFNDTRNQPDSLSPTHPQQQQQQQQQRQNAVVEQHQGDGDGSGDHMPKFFQSNNMASPHTLRPIPIRLASTPIVSKSKDMSEFGDDLFLQSTFESYDREGNTTFRRPSLARLRSPGARHHQRSDWKASQSHLNMEAALPRTGAVGDHLKTKLHAYALPTRPINMAWPQTLVTVARPPSRRRGPLSPSSSAASSPCAVSRSGSPSNNVTRVPLSESSFNIQTNRQSNSRPSSQLGSKPNSRPSSRPSSRLGQPQSPVVEKALSPGLLQECNGNYMDQVEMDWTGVVHRGPEIRVKSPGSKAQSGINNSARSSRQPHRRRRRHRHHQRQQQQHGRHDNADNDGYDRLFEPVPTATTSSLLISDSWLTNDYDRWKSPTLSALASDTSSRGSSPRAISPMWHAGGQQTTGRRRRGHSRHLEALPPVDTEPLRSEIVSIEAHDEISLQDIWRMEDEERQDRLKGVGGSGLGSRGLASGEGQAGWFRTMEDHDGSMKGEAHAHAEARLIQEVLHPSHV
ncbi:hypothetical protein BGW38_010585 [Lunasporangiospora selenospora]|uniref:Uncharacterized protein n=1 Tax=Lunasporangiospora selenospora TaxID=979761 RepID=A0A9P6KFL9_9FUNG|nr:hypothetical protein BGW38_010585 [Lunasporangiospora selenospora]